MSSPATVLDHDPHAKPASRRKADASESPAGAPPRIVFALPAYNEGASLGLLLERIQAAMASARRDYVVIVVDDGSRDDTAQVASRFSFSMPVVLVEHGINRGLAAGLRTGFTTALAHAGPDDVIVTMDADDTHPPGLTERMVGLIGEGHDVVIASRFRPGARVLGVPRHRQALSIGARMLFQAAFRIPGVRDYTCGFRAYRAEVLRRAMADYGDQFVSETGFSCMADVLLKLRKYPLVMGEAPLILRYDQKGGASKMQVLRTVRQTLSLIARRVFG